MEKENKKIVLAFSLDPEVATWLDSYAKAEGLSRSHIVSETLAWLRGELDSRDA